MNSRWLIGIMLIGIIGFAGLAYSHGMSGRGCSSGSHMGPMMGTQHGCCCPMMQHTTCCPGMHRTEKLTKDDVQTCIRDYLHRLGNPNLKQGKVKETEQEFEVEIVTKDNSLVEKILIDKETGCLRQTY